MAVPDETDTDPRALTHGAPVRPGDSKASPEDAGSSLFYSTAGTDRPLAPRPWWQQRRVRFAAAGVAAAIAAALLIQALAHFAGTAGSVDRSRLTIATVERGTFVRDVAADGQVVAPVSPTL